MMPLPPGVDVDVLTFLERHETTIHSLPGRDLRDLGDAVLITDPGDREPFWNRMAAIRWPAEGRAFDGRLDEAITLFATLDRIPHIWPRPALREPPDIAERLTAYGFENVGEGHVMVLVDRDVVLHVADTHLPPDTTVERLAIVSGLDLAAAAMDVATVLNESFNVDPGRQASIELETETMLQRPELETFLVRVEGEPAATGRAATIDGATYLASIGTRPRFRGRGLGRLVTALIAAAGVREGSRWIHLGVFADNVGAIRMYERLGFERVGETAADMILR
jgi:GNAT superfamily N-acetyltransferase